MRRGGGGGGGAREGGEGHLQGERQGDHLVGERGRQQADRMAGAASGPGIGQRTTQQ